MPAKPGQGAPTPAEVRAHAFELVKQLDDQGKIKLDGAPDAAQVARMMPDFSAGTSALDEATGEPITATQVVAMPDTGVAAGTTDDLAAAKAEISGEPQDSAAVVSEPQRDNAGRFVAASDEAQPATAPPAAEETSSPQAAVEAAAGEMLKDDPWSEYEEIEYDDPDLEKKFSVRVRKEDANALKGGYQRRADYTRKTMQLAQARKTLQPLIDNNTFAQIEPLIAMATTDNEFADFVVAAFQRRKAGLPLTQQQQQAVAAVQQVAEPQVQQPAPQIEGDPYLDPRIESYTQPLNAEVQRVLGTVNELAAAEQRRQQATQAQEAENARRINFMAQSHQAMVNFFPDEFNGDWNHDQAAFTRACDYAVRSGMVQQYGESPTTIVAAWQQNRQNRAEAAASPAAEALNRDAARNIARANAASVSTGAPATNTAKPPAPPPPPATRTNGAATNIKDYLRQNLERQKALQQT